MYPQLDKLREFCKDNEVYIETNDHDDEIVCDICLDGTGQAENIVVICDGCNAATH